MGSGRAGTLTSVSRSTTTGDLVEVQLFDQRLGYLQDSGDVRGCTLVRFLPGTYDRAQRGTELDRLVASPSTYRAHCILDGLLDEGTGRIVGNFPVPHAELSPPDMVDAALSFDWRNWSIILSDGDVMSGEEYARANPGVDLRTLSREDEILDADIIRARMTRGWKPGDPEESAPKQADSESWMLIAQPRTMYLSYFAESKLANDYANRMRSEISQVEVEQDAKGSEWSVGLVRDGYFEEDFDQRARAITQELGGSYSGDVDVST